MCKMWDDSWKVLEHPDFTDKPFYDSPDDFDPKEHWWSLRYSMSIDEMNKFNQMEKEMGAVVSISEGEAAGEISKIFKNKLFEEM